MASPTRRPKITGVRTSANTFKPVEPIVERNRTNIGVKVLAYPQQLPQQRLLMSFSKYNYSGASAGGLIRAVPNPNGAIVLPLPEALQDNTAINNQSFELGAAGGFTAQLLNSDKGIMENIKESMLGVGQVGQEISAKSIAELKSTFAQFAGLVGRQALDGLGISGLSGAIDVTGGTAVNPHATVRFEGVPLKTHTLTWKFAPTNARDAAALRDVINELKKRALPAYTSLLSGTTFERALLNYPDLVRIILLGISTDHFYYFKTCMITNITTNYGAAGSLALNAGGKPSVVSLSVGLVETAIHTSSDYGGQGDSVQKIPEQKTSNPHTR